jgi:hypothetical protein
MDVLGEIWKGAGRGKRIWEERECLNFGKEGSSNPKHYLDVLHEIYHGTGMVKGDWERERKSKFRE